MQNTIHSLSGRVKRQDGRLNVIGGNVNAGSRLQGLSCQGNHASCFFFFFFLLGVFFSAAEYCPCMRSLRLDQVLYQKKAGQLLFFFVHLLFFPTFSIIYVSD